METKIKKSETLPIGKTCTNLLKGAFILCILLVYFNAEAQIVPAANIVGPGKALIGKGNVFVTSQIASDVTPTTSYTILNNTTGASIVSKGPIVLDNATGIRTQTIEVNPGNSNGRINIKLVVTNPTGSTEAVKGVTVVNMPN